MRNAYVRFCVLIYILFAAIFPSCKKPVETNLEQDLAIADETNTSDWLAYGRTHSERRFSPLTALEFDVNDLWAYLQSWFIPRI